MSSTPPSLEELSQGLRFWMEKRKMQEDTVGLLHRGKVFSIGRFGDFVNTFSLAVAAKHL
jgi:hypothetical protein